MVTTIKLHERTKALLDKEKKSSQSYDQAILDLLHRIKSKNLRERLVQGYSSMSQEEYKEFQAWDQLDA